MSILDNEKVARAREKQLEDILREVRLFSKRADTPEDRVALAEIEHELLEIQKRWTADGMLPEPELSGTYG